MSLRSYNYKVVQSGSIVEIYQYSNPIWEGYEDTKKGSKGRSVIADDEDKKINKEKNLSRASRKLRRLVNSNIETESKFVTLTFKENVTDIKTANYEFKKFKQRLEYDLGLKLKYLVVPERQKRGAWHYHCIMFNLPYTPDRKLKSIWGNGFIKINRIDHVDNVGAYISKYISKDFADDHDSGQKCYFASKNLDKPIELKDESLVKSVVDSLLDSQKTYETQFQNDYNTISYKQYNIDK